MMSDLDVAKVFRRFNKENPDPRIELEHTSDFELLVAVILSAQATDVGVNKATKILYKVANTPEQLLKLGLTRFKSYIKSIGLYNTKAKNILKTCKILVDDYDSEVPGTREELEALPGVGRKSANVMLNVSFGQSTIPVDTHVFRVSNRTKMAPGKTPLEVEKLLLERVPKRYKKRAHHWLVLHGRYTCTARKPKCAKCAIEDLCPYVDKVY